jgi:ankyrin repeat domain-containing protein 17
MVIEAAKGGHTHVVQLLIDFPNSILVTPPPPPQLSEVAGTPSMLDPQAGGVLVPLAEANSQASPNGNPRSVPPTIEGHNSLSCAEKSFSIDSEYDEDVDDDEEVPGLHGK